MSKDLLDRIYDGIIKKDHKSLEYRLSKLHKLSHVSSIKIHKILWSIIESGDIILLNKFITSCTFSIHYWHSSVKFEPNILLKALELKLDNIGHYIVNSPMLSTAYHSLNQDEVMKSAAMHGCVQTLDAAFNAIKNNSIPIFALVSLASQYHHKSILSYLFEDSPSFVKETLRNGCYECASSIIYKSFDCLEYLLSKTPRNSLAQHSLKNIDLVQICIESYDVRYLAAIHQHSDIILNHNELCQIYESICKSRHMKILIYFINNFHPPIEKTVFNFEWAMNVGNIDLIATLFQHFALYDVVSYCSYLSRFEEYCRHHNREDIIKIAHDCFNHQADQHYVPSDLFLS